MGIDADQVTTDLATVRDYVRWAMSCLLRGEVHLGHGTDDPWDEALALVLHVLALPVDADPRVLDARLTRAERTQVVALVRRRVEERVPLAYLTQEAWFAGLPFHVDERVLVPRSPVADLIARAFHPWLDAGRVARVLELCTGSGCIAIACAQVFPDAHVTATDLSPDALDVARLNVARYGLGDRLELRQGDLWAGAAGRYELVVSNPPYVDAADMATLPPEYRHEPALGLAAGADGLDLAVRILAGAADFLTDDGLLVVEVGNSADALLDLFPDVAFVWPEFEDNEGGVFLLPADEVRAHAAAFRAEAARRV